MVIDDTGQPTKAIVIIGGTGYVGRYLTEYLSINFPNNKIIVVTRNISKSIFFINMKNVTVVSDIRELKLVNCTIINLAFAIGLTEKITLELFEEFMSKLKDSLADDFFGRIIHTSSIAVLGYPLKSELQKPKPLPTVIKATDSYSMAKWHAEISFYKIAEKTKAKVYIVRCGNVVGPGSTWADKIVKRLIDKKPLIGSDKKYPSNMTFIGNLVYGLAELSTGNYCSKDKNLRIMNFAEFGSISWEQWVLDVAEILKIEPCAWEVSNISECRPSLKEDMSHILREIMTVAIPLIYKSKATSKYVYKILNHLNAVSVKEKAKQVVYNKKKSAYMDMQEFRMGQLFMNETKIGLEEVPVSIGNRLPYTYVKAIGSLKNWVKYSCYDALNLSLK